MVHSYDSVSLAALPRPYIHREIRSHLEKLFVRTLFLLAALVTLAGCGTAASSSTPSPAAVSTLIPTAPVQPSQRWLRPPPMTINPTHSYQAVISTNRGSFTIQLLPKVAPITVNSFVFLARHNYFDHNTFLRIIRDFMVQTGDPSGSGYGGPGYVFRNEIDTRLKYTVGTVAMANSGKDTNGSQFFIVTGPQALSLPHDYTIFGRVSKGMSTVLKIARTPVTINPATQEVSKPLANVYIAHIAISDTVAPAPKKTGKKR